MRTSWAAEEVKEARLQDERLNKRLVEVLSQLGAKPTASIPAACGGYAETAAAYRFFDNKKTNFDNVLHPHIEATRRRIAEPDVVLLVQDTTEIDLTRPATQVAGAGPLGSGPRRGVFLHALAGFTPDGTPQGMVHAKVWAREEAPVPSRSERARRRKQTPIEEKESERWLEALRRARAEVARAPQTQFVCIADSEADIYELLAETRAEPHRPDFIVRASQDRALLQDEQLPEQAERSEQATNTLRAQMLTRAVLFTHTIHVRGRQAKVAFSTRERAPPRWKSARRA